jgi:receptor protein-tyrosine kinase/non-specific protein-tyrosine kinase
MSRIEKALEKAAQLRKSGSAEVRNDQPSAPQWREQPAQQTSPYSRSEIVNINPNNLYLTTLNDPDSLASEEYRKLKSILVKMTKGEKFNNVLMVTSAIADEGKSITALNLAISLAREFDHTVLLIDADLRRPSIHKYLDIEPGLGLADCLADGIDIGKTIINTGIGKLSVIPAGKVLQNPLEFFTSQKMQDLIAEIKHRYPDRYVIIDTPPYLPFAETRSLSHLVDGVILVVKEGLASQESIKEALESLKECNVLGVVFNDATISNQDGRYKDYHYSRTAYKEPLAKSGSSR